MNKVDLPAIQYTVWPADLHGHRYQVKLQIAKPNPEGQVLQMPVLSWRPPARFTAIPQNILRLKHTTEM